jgi:hypothetical protein
MHSISRTLLLCFTLVSLSTIGFAANPTFDIKTISAAGVGGAVVTADFDHDGNADFATDVGAKTAVFFGDGSGNFTRVNAGPGLGFLQIADVDGDGHPDLVGSTGQITASGPPPIVVLRNNGDRTFKALAPFTVAGWNGVGFAAGDFDGDGKADLALRTDLLVVSVLVGNGDGTFQAAHPVYTANVANAFDPTNYSIESVQTTADFDGNGKVDFMVSEGQTNLFGGSVISFMLNQGSLNFAPQQFSQQSFDAAVPLDANGDGKADIGFNWEGCHTPCGGGDVWSLSTGKPQQIDNAQWDDAFNLFPGSPVAADFNGDGQPDIAWSYGTFLTFDASGLPTTPHQSVVIHLGPPQINPTNTVEIQVGPDDQGNPDAMASADFNNDGASDIVVVSIAHNAIHVMLNTTVGAVKPGFKLAVAPSAATVAAGQSATFTATVTPQGGFTSNVTFSCSGLPAGAACTFTPASLVPSNGPAKSPLAITTTARTSAALIHHQPAGMFLALSLPFFGIVCVGAAPRNWKRLVTVAALCTLLIAACVSCGGFSGPKASTTPPPNNGGGGGAGGSGGGMTGTPAGTYTVVVAAQGGGITQQANITLNVQ